MSEEVKAQEAQQSPMQELTKPSATVSKSVLKKLKALSKDALVTYVLELSDAFEMQKMANTLLHKSYQAKILELAKLKPESMTPSEVTSEDSNEVK